MTRMHIWSLMTMGALLGQIGSPSDWRMFLIQISMSGIALAMHWAANR
jgi:hypothetical protein